ncbi:hypothetical protein COB52_03460 [Candidatus Kaiserbacteria bacterium]|nr:MAG: hypothetical protein COB52_03460 [Candidatus Kaiserbacteria bacterium]
MTAFKNMPPVFMMRRMWRFSKGNRPNVIAFIILFALSNIVGLTSPLIFAWFINEIQLNGVSYDNIGKLSGILLLPVVTEILFWCFHSAGRYLEIQNSLLSKINYRHYFLSGTLGLGMQWHNDRDTGDTLDKIDKATRSLSMFSRNLYSVFKIIFSIGGAVIVLYFFNAYISIGVLLAIVVAFYALSRFDNSLVTRQKALNKFENKIAAAIFDTISNITTVLILNIQRPVLKRLKNLLNTPIKKTAEQTRFNELKWFSGSLMFKFIVITPLIFFLFYELEQGNVIAIGTITALYLYLNRMSDAFFSFSNMYENILFWKANIENADEIDQAIRENTKEKGRTSATDWKTLYIRNLNFSYTGLLGDDSKHLDEISLTIKKGESIAFIGESGSGKTTFLKVLHGLYDTAEASVAFDGNEKLNTNFQGLGLKTMLVPQEPEVFSSTILENMTLGLTYTKQEVSKAVKIAQFTSVVKQLPKGLKSVINERGVNLSGGQKQRLALARALLFSSNKEIILLDESTSSVDSENEQKIYENIFKAFKGKTVLASIHKMNLLKYFDRIIMFADGKIVDQGTFNELLSKNAKFKKNWDEFIELGE